MSKKTRSELKREAILNAAKTAFLEAGVDGTSMDKLASLAGVSKRTVYNHFSSKEELVMELVSNLWREAVSEIDVGYQAGVPLEQQLAQVLLAEMNASCSAEYIEIARVAFGYYFYSQQELQKQLSKMSKADSAIMRWFRQAIDDKQVRSCDVQVATEQTYALIKGHYFWPLLIGMRDFPSQEEMSLHAKRCAELLLSHYKI